MRKLFPLLSPTRRPMVHALGKSSDFEFLAIFIRFLSHNVDFCLEASNGELVFIVQRESDCVGVSNHGRTSTPWNIHAPGHGFGGGDRTSIGQSLTAEIFRQLNWQQLIVALLVLANNNHQTGRHVAGIVR